MRGKNVMKTINEDIICTFVVPVYIEENNIEYLEYFKQTINSVIEQTCPDWSMVIVDNHSRNGLLDQYIDEIVRQQNQTIIYQHNKSNMGVGFSRNKGIELAYEKLHSDIIMFQDADDLAHSNRVEATKEIFGTTNADLVYSSFIPIDEYGDEISFENLSYSIKHIILTHSEPPVGNDVWKAMVAGKGYINLTSTTSVRMEIARSVPFPTGRSSEDVYTWLLYSAHGACFYYIKETPCKYRIPQNVKGSSSRNYIGMEKFYQDFVDINFEAFFECSQYALKNGTATKEEIKVLAPLFYGIITEVLRKEEMYDLADKVSSLTNTYLYELDLVDLPKRFIVPE